MRPLLSALKDGLRLIALRKPQANLGRYGADTFVAAMVFYLAIEFLRSLIDTESPRVFVGYGVVTVFADAMLTFVAAWLMTRIAHRSGIICAVASLALIATALNAAIVQWILELIATWGFANRQNVIALVAAWLIHAWWLFILIVMTRWLGPRRWPINLASAMLAFLISAVPWWFLPSAPIYMHDAASAQVARAVADNENLAKLDHASAIETFDPEYVMYDQERLVDAALSALAPRVSGKPNLYVVAFAGDGNENVFRNESEFVERLFSERFDASGHIVVLQNNPASVDTRPLATLTNLRWALEGIAERMHPAEDILFVYFTSHGSAEHQLHIALDPLPLNQISPELIASALQTSPAIRWKVIVVNACYAGGFIDALRDDSTLVIAAARPDRTSFGCGTESEITYFGKAFLAEALNQTTSFPEAFTIARKSVAEWEARDKVEEHSEPQIASSRSIEAKLASWQKTLSDRPVVPFTPAKAQEPQNQNP